MKVLKLKLQNCYGIEKLETEFKFVFNRKENEISSNCFVVYAPNGVMKTSLARTFSQLSTGQFPKDEIYERDMVCEVAADGVVLAPNEIFVIHSSIDTSKESEHTSALLVDAVSKEKYDEISKDILKRKDALITNLNKCSGIPKKDLESQLLKDFNEKDFLTCLQNIDAKVFEDDLSVIKYNDIFDGDVIEILKNNTLTENIDKYVEEYNKVISAYPYFKKGVFNPAKAEKVSGTLSKEGFFAANNTINLHGEDKAWTQQDLDQKLKETQKSILENQELKKVRDLMLKKAKCVKFQEIVEGLDDPNILLLEIKNLEEFRQRLWKSYCKNDAEFSPFVNDYTEKEKELIEIEGKANFESSKWKSAIDIFNNRFLNMPYVLDIENKQSCLVGREVPNVVFLFTDEKTGKKVSFKRSELHGLNILSQGEKRALYILNLIFEVESRRNNKQKTLFIVDDIADSFDYKNKYAIIQYLKDISEEPMFYQIILTHNFDFFRTIQERILTSNKWDNSFIAQRNKDEIVLIKAGKKEITNPFEQWRQDIDKEKKIFVACIPFVRNLIDFKEGNSENYMLLTSLLHIKDDSETINVGKIKEAYLDNLKGINLDNYDQNDKVLDYIYSVADAIEAEKIKDDSINLEDKVVLSMAIRLKAETLILSKIKENPKFKGNQTGKLTQVFKDEFKDIEAMKPFIAVFDEVNLITPENIHLNSFMYEPILDISTHHLKNIYKKIKDLF